MKGAKITSAAALRTSSTCPTEKVAISHLPIASLSAKKKIPASIKAMPASAAVAADRGKSSWRRSL